jgi:CRP/FNR family transcriptional regulator, cyclic AMP receptor protein
MKEQTILQVLSNQPLFCGVSQASLEELSRASRIKKTPKGSFIFFQSDAATAVYLVIKGAVTVHLENLEGRELVINEVGPGDCFGELGAFTGQPHSASAEACEDSEILTIGRQVFLGVLKKEHALALNILARTAQRLQDSSRREEALAFQDAQQRLAGLLLALDRQNQEKGYIRLSHEDLARRTGLTRQTTSTVLGRWRRNGWLLTGRGNIVLLNRGELRKVQQPLECVTEEWS